MLHLTSISGEWQDISTAPDNVAVLIYAPGNYRSGCEGAWSWSVNRAPDVYVAICEDGRWTSDLVEFYRGWESTGSYTITQELSPTHWMPIPPSPPAT